MHPKSSSVSNSFRSSRQFGRDRHHTNCALGSLPETLELPRRRLNQIFWGMYTALDVTDERTLQMDPDRAGTTSALATFCSLSPTIKSLKGSPFRRRDRSGKIGGHSVLRQLHFNLGQS